ncbi:MAG: Biotin-dependent carboxylase uncharacterized protein [Marmoricola sp.]|jgi:biotin-dependent carboxylase-like uncharacterized protein|nr:Biotin-dependent carboxylase uncharacterized protein [Marmoricola sp.]
MAERSLEVLRAGPQVTVQDLGRTGRAHLGVPRSGALDGPAHRLANRLVGNDESAATLECLGGQLTVRARTAVTIAVTGARVPVAVAGRQREWGNAVAVPAGAEVELGVATQGLRAYLAVSGGIAVEPVLGSRSTDLLSGLGPDVVGEGDVLPVGDRVRSPVPVEAVPAPPVSRVLRMRLGPRDDWFERACVAALTGSAYVVGSDSNRIGLRLEGEPIRRRRDDELPSEGMVLGAVQVPPSGQPVVFLHDHPTTGGYPVVGVVLAEDLATCAQLRPGDEVTLRVV